MRMFCGLPTSVAAEPTLAAQATARRNGTGSSPRVRERSITTGATASATTSFVKTAESGPTTAMRSARSLSGGPSPRPDTRRHGGVHAPEAELRREDHHAEEQGERGDVHVLHRPRERHFAGREQRDGAEQSDPRAVHAEARDAAEDHAGVHEDEDGEDHECRRYRRRARAQNESRIPPLNARPSRGAQTSVIQRPSAPCEGSTRRS